jgi:TonB-dependent starch-binding outer membrane protein SusC
MDFHLDRWTPNNPEATYPRLTVGSESANNAAKSDFWIQNAAYLRVKNIQLGYTLPASVSKKAGMSNCRIFFTGNNLFTFSKLRAGYDPEVNNGNAQSGRVYPVAAVYAFGLDLKF